VRVNAVAPGLIATPWTEGWSEERRATTVSRTLLNRLGQPAEIAQAMLYLAVGATYMTGETIVLDGGAN
jgi:3-oxoacyl-[acyl-carrier protein] reductase